MIWTVNPAKAADIHRIANAMRAADVLECGALGHSPKEALRRSLRASTLAWTLWRDDRPVAMFGVVPLSLMSRRAAPWMLGTDDLSKAGRRFMEWGPPWIDAMLGDWWTLENRVAVENRRAIRVLLLLGFVLDEKIVHIGGVPMRRFSKVRDRV